MIRVAREGSEEARCEARLRSIGSDLEALTHRDRRLAEEAGEGALAPLRAMGELPVGAALVTPAGELEATFLLHVVLRSREEAVSSRTVRRGFLNALRQAAEWGVETLAASPLGIGAGNLDAEQSARIMTEVAREHRSERSLPREVVVVVASDYEEEAFRAAQDAPA